MLNKACNGALKNNFYSTEELIESLLESSLNNKVQSSVEGKYKC